MLCATYVVPDIIFKVVETQTGTIIITLIVYQFDGNVTYNEDKLPKYLTLTAKIKTTKYIETMHMFCMAYMGLRILEKM